MIWYLLRDAVQAQPMPSCVVRQSVPLSRSWIMSKRVIVSSKFFHHRVAKPFSFFRTKRHGNVPTGTLLTGASNFIFIYFNFIFFIFFILFLFISFARRPVMLGLMGFSGSLPLYVIHRYYIFVFIDRANKDACLLADCARLFTAETTKHQWIRATEDYRIEFNLMQR